MQLLENNQQQSVGELLLPPVLILFVLKQHFARVYLSYTTKADKPFLKHWRTLDCIHLQLHLKLLNIHKSKVLLVMLEETMKTFTKL